MLSEKIGMIVDEYSNARLYPDHVRILLKELRKHSKQASVSDLTRLFEKVVEEDALLIVRGD